MFRKLAVLFLFSVWIGSAGYVFWHFQVKHFGFFQKDRKIDWEIFDRLLREELKKISLTDVPMVLYFKNTGCLCNRYSDRKMEKIVGSYSEFRYILVPAPRQDIQLRENDLSKTYGPALSPQAVARLWSLLPAAPVAVVVDRDLSVAYFGPYEAAAFCTAAKEGFVETTLDLLRRGEKIQNINLWERACFCPVREQI